MNRVKRSRVRISSVMTQGFERNRWVGNILNFIDNLVKVTEFSDETTISKRGQTELTMQNTRRAQ